MKTVWIFQGAGAKFPCVVCTTKKNAEKLIKKNKLTGILTEYPLDIFIYDWAIKNNTFLPKKELEFSTDFKQQFTSSDQKHYHYEGGELD